jgi:formylglycine-generating enzyme required for sulfatase activity
MQGFREEPEEMVMIPSATTRIGTDSVEIPALMRRFSARRSELFTAEIPAYTVTIQSFALNAREVTNAEFATFVAAKPSWSKDSVSSLQSNGRYLEHWPEGRPKSGEKDQPVTFITWHAASAYCAWREGRLPTEAEWEYASRAGRLDAEFPWGNEMPESRHARWGGSTIQGLANVGSYTPNAFGLYDMAGNVWEFVQDGWRDRYDAPIPTGNETARYVIRGGSWQGAAVNLRSRYRDSHSGVGAGPHIGFRCARST